MLLNRLSGLSTGGGGGGGGGGTGRRHLSHRCLGWFRLSCNACTLACLSFCTCSCFCKFLHCRASHSICRCLSIAACRFARFRARRHADRYPCEDRWEEDNGQNWVSSFPALLACGVRHRRCLKPADPAAVYLFFDGTAHWLPELHTHKSALIRSSFAPTYKLGHSPPGPSWYASDSYRMWLCSLPNLTSRQPQKPQKDPVSAHSGNFGERSHTRADLSGIRQLQIYAKPSRACYALRTCQLVECICLLRHPEAQSKATMASDALVARRAGLYFSLTPDHENPVSSIE
ncbi:hypothetical protein AG1IA_03631 [Rhizoctonia solani AG-1 IA]|uniref:Uncharacterized protein n=1 Tax=Thanatephorus cucumeris (strain AG1-IA) TaxID=983506 RepID=L8WW95_THACA|nr:hypothetical protein AG1IA_03631 [Rhizoctonia solani AG-1 IA]